jgi:hypothetical protein
MAIIIGAMKAATTSLFEYLSEHPQVATCRVKEPGFFAFDHLWSNGPDWYFRLWDFDPARHSLALEASTDYTKRPYVPFVPEKIASLDRVRFRLIYMLRHPLRRIESQARHAALTGAEIGHLFEPERNFSFDSCISERAVNFSRYAYQIDGYMQYFGRDDILFLTSEDLQKDPNESLRRVCEFLELEPHSFSGSTQFHNTARGHVRPHPAWSLFASFESPRRIFLRTVPQGLKRRLRQIGAKKPSGRYRLTPEEEEYVLALLLPDLRKIQDYYGIDIAQKWGIQLDTIRARKDLPEYYNTSITPP